MYKVQVIAKKTKKQNKNQNTKKKQQKNQTNGKVMYECGERWCIGSAL